MLERKTLKGKMKIEEKRSDIKKLIQESRHQAGQLSRGQRTTVMMYIQMQCTKSECKYGVFKKLCRARGGKSMGLIRNHVLTRVLSLLSSKPLRVPLMVLLVLQLMRCLSQKIFLPLTSPFLPIINNKKLFL